MGTHILVLNGGGQNNVACVAIADHDSYRSLIIYPRALVVSGRSTRTKWITLLGKRVSGGEMDPNPTLTAGKKRSHAGAEPEKAPQDAGDGESTRECRGAVERMEETKNPRWSSSSRGILRVRILYKAQRLTELTGA